MGTSLCLPVTAVESSVLVCTFPLQKGWLCAYPALLQWESRTLHPEERQMVPALQGWQCVSLQERSQSTQTLPGALLPAARGAGSVGLAQLPCLPGAVPPGAAAPAPLLLSAGPPSAAPGDSSWPWGPSGEEEGRAWPQSLLPAEISFSEPYSHWLWE